MDAAKTYIENLYKNQAKSLQQRMERRKAGGGGDTPHSLLPEFHLLVVTGVYHVPCSAPGVGYSRLECPCSLITKLVAHVRATLP